MSGYSAKISRKEGWTDKANVVALLDWTLNVFVTVPDTKGLTGTVT